MINKSASAIAAPISAVPSISRSAMLTAGPSAKDKTPLPFVTNTCPFEPSALGKSNAIPLDVKIRWPPSEDIDSFASCSCSVGVPPLSVKSKPVLD
jgi:hypothetical protein